MDLALNNLQRFIAHKTQTTKHSFEMHKLQVSDLWGFKVK